MTIYHPPIDELTLEQLTIRLANARRVDMSQAPKIPREMHAEEIRDLELALTRSRADRAIELERERRSLLASAFDALNHLETEFGDLDEPHDVETVDEVLTALRAGVTVWEALRAFMLARTSSQELGS